MLHDLDDDNNLTFILLIALLLTLGVHSGSRIPRDRHE